DRNSDPEVDCLNRDDADKNTVLAHLVRLGLETSFTGKDRLRTYLVTGNFDGGGFTNAESLNTYMARLSYQAGLNNNVVLDLLEYRFPAFNDRVVFSVIPFGFSLSNVLSANSAYFDTGRGSISRFGEASPIFKLGGVLDAGAGFDWLFAKNARLQVAYGTGGSGNPDSGVFGADRSALGVQLLATPTNNLITGLTYVNAYTSDGTLGTFTGSVNAETNGLWSDSSIPPAGSNILDPNSPSGFDPCCGVFLGDAPAKTNAIGATLQWRVSQNLTFGAWGGYMFTNFLEELPDGAEFRNSLTGIGASAGKKPFANAATYLFSLGLSDPFGREGDLFAFLFGMPPKLVDAGPETPGTPVPFFETSRRGEPEVPVTDNNRNLDTVGVGDEPTAQREGLPKRVGVKDEATSLHFEVFYRFRVSDNLFITPGVVLVTNPGHIEDNNDIWLATIRTTFRF
ncbi:iron uptake porin, partial [Chroococcidiopsis sp.]|uniref:iron uptake porin n=1 Tax=Chroococcidiopsis sp. TaxID=3088168 RepID=UPI003F3E9471